VDFALGFPAACTGFCQAFVEGKGTFDSFNYFPQANFVRRPGQRNSSRSSSLAYNQAGNDQAAQDF